MKKLKVTKLVLDYGLYPRHEMDSTVTTDLAKAMEAGETLPPIIADRASLKVVDGFHRTTAALRIHGEDAEVQVELRDYASDAAMFLDAVRLNARHGYKLTKFDAARCMQKADEMSIDPDAMAGALAITVDTAAKLKAAKTAYDPQGNAIPIKRSLRHLSGQKLTERQTEFNRRASGWSIRFHAQQIIEAIESDSVEWDDAETAAALGRLLTALTARVALAS